MVLICKERLTLLESKVVFIDGHCIMCHKLANYVFKHDRRNAVKVSALQGKTAAAHLPLEISQNLETVAYLRDGEILLRSTAAIKLLSDLGGWRKGLKVFLILPEFLRDGIYNFIAKRRFNWFGKKETCEIPSENYSHKVLD